MSKRPPMPAPERLPASELAQLAIDAVEGRAFITNSEEGIRNSFGLMVAMVDFDHVVDQIGALYEYMEKAMPRGINGQPMFASMRVLHADDLEPLRTRMTEYLRTRADFLTAAELA